MRPQRPVLLAATILAVVLVQGYLFGPDRIALHFGLDGSADRMGSRARWLVELGLVGTGMTVLFLAVLRAVGRMPLSRANLPNKEYWTRPENQQRARGMLLEDISRLGASTLLVLGALAVLTLAVSRDPQPRLGSESQVVLLGYLALVTLWALVSMPRRYRIPRDGPGESDVRD